MPPRFAYWTILIDNTATAFRARDRAELLPTVTQLKRTNANVELKWFAQGRLWESPEAQQASWRKPKAAIERRDRDWRPGGDHKDPRARFDKEASRRRKRDERARADRPPRPAAARFDRPPRPAAARFGKTPWKGQAPPPRDRKRPWGAKPAGDRKPWQPPRKKWPTGPPHRRKRRDDEPPDQT